jgi:hypothetical protein
MAEIVELLCAEDGDKKKTMKPEVAVDFEKKHSVDLVHSLQLLFARMLVGDRVVVSPEEVLSHVIGHDGTRVVAGRQEDVMEFNEMFLTRVEEGLSCLFSPPPEETEGKGKEEEEEDGSVFSPFEEYDLLLHRINHKEN